MRKGLPKFKAESKMAKKEHEDSRRQGCCLNRGGRLGCFMIFDALNTIITVALFFVFVFVLKEDDDISLRGVIYFCKTVYGLLSFPFIIFAIPILAEFLTKSKATKYDK